MESEIFAARVEDLFTLCACTCVPKFLGFLTTEEAAQADRIFANLHASYRFFGGFPEAERTVAACLPDWCEEPDYPISALTFRFRDCDTLSHRDFLGALMSLGVTRESVGDILTEQGRAVVFLKDDIVSFVKSQLEKVGNVGVVITDGFEAPLPSAGKEITCSESIASARLDCVVGALCGFSRNQAAEWIADGRVAVNSLCVQKYTRTVAAADRVSVRGKGRFTVLSVEEHTRKGRVILQYSKFIS